MPEDLFRAYANAYQMPNFSFGPLQQISQMYGGGQQFQPPPRFDPMDFYKSIYGQQAPTGSYARPTPVKRTGERG